VTPRDFDCEHCQAKPGEFCRAPIEQRTRVVGWDTVPYYHPQRVDTAFKAMERKP